MSNQKPREAELEQTRRDLARAVKDVLGEFPETRNPSQKVFWQYLEQASYQHRPSFIPDTDGKFDPIRAAITDGRRGLFLEIKAIVESDISQPETVSVTKVRSQ